MAKPMSVSDPRLNLMLKKVEWTFLNLFERWQEEHKYEDIKEYSAIIARKLPPGFVMGKMTKKPFGFFFTLDHTVYKLATTATESQISISISTANKGH